jgi:CelD/BcsL family acetyltransferase involved in cellulose biosynthesis
LVAAGRVETPRPTADLDVVDRLEPLREEWARLGESARNIFATWEWNELWWRHFGDGRPLRVGAIRDGDGDVEAIVPLFVWSRRPLGTLRLLGHGHGDRLGPICPEDQPQAAARALRLALAAEPHDVFVGDWVGGEHEWGRVLRGRVVRTTGYPILRLPERSWDEFLAARSQRFRKSLRHSRNRLARHHAFTVRPTAPETLEHDLDAVFRLHRSRFTVHAGCSFCGGHEPFQREFARIALERDWLRLLLLEVDGEPVAAEYGFLFQDAYFAYQGGRDPAWDRYSVGFVLEAAGIRRALEEGAVEYRFLGGDEQYKYRYPTEDPRLETVVAPATGRGRAAAAALDAAWRLPGGKAVLRRIGS